MAFVSNRNQQLTLTDSTENLTEREKRFLDRSWAKVFSEKVFPAIKEERFSVLYSNKASRPNTPVNVIIGAMILKESMGVTDDELVEALMFDIRYQYALHTTSFEEQPLSDRTLSRFRARCLAYETETGIDLIHECIVSMAKEISIFMGIKPDTQRMDSLMIAANIKNLSLLELFYTCVANLAHMMKKRGTDIPQEQLHYVEKDDENRFLYHRKELSDPEKTILVMKDAEKLIKICEDKYDDTSEFQLLIRLLREQTIEDNGKRRLRERSEKDNPSKALLNPADPEATFRKKAGKKHRGYVGNIVESVGENGSLITDYAYEQNTYSDSQFAKDYLEDQPLYDNEVTLIADGAYSGEKNAQTAREHNIKLITTNFTGVKPDDIYCDFKFSNDNKLLLECANKEHPIDCVYDESNDRSVAYFNCETCENCPLKDRCKPRFLKNRVRKEVSWKAKSRALQLRYMQTDELKDYAHFRNGVEAIPSLLRRRYKVDKIPAHGKLRTKLHFGFKVAALNLNKLLDYYNGLVNYTSKLKTA